MKNILKKIGISGATVIIMFVTSVLILAFYIAKFLRTFNLKNPFRNLSALRDPVSVSVADFKKVTNL